MGRSAEIVCLGIALTAVRCAKYQPIAIDPVKTAGEVRSRAIPARLDANSLTAAAVANSGNVAIARARLAEAEAAIVTAKQRINPSLSAEGGYNRTPESVTTYSSALAFTIETGGKRAYRTLAAQKNAEAARIAVNEAEWQARSAARLALVKYSFAQKSLSSAREEVGARRQVVEIFDARLRLGEASRPELDSARADLATAEAALTTAQGNATQALSEVATATGLPAQGLEGKTLEINVADQPLTPDSLPLTEVQKAGLLHRADIRQTLAEYEAADARLRLELANQYPNVTLSPAYTFQEGFPAYTLGAALESLPILHRHEGPIGEADAARREVRARFIALQAQVIAETDAALRQYRTAVAAWASVRDSVVAVQAERERQVRIAFQAGQMDRLDVSQAHLTTIGAERALLDARQRAEIGLTSLEDAVQSRLDQEASH
jgi:outer membrane protein TolC